MEQKLDELLKQIHRYLFADSEQVIVELRQYMLDRSLKEAELAFISAKVFNSKESLLQFLRQNFSQNERILATIKKRIYELIIDYMKLRRQEVSHYLEEIKETCLITFVGDPNYLVKEAAVQVLIKIIESFDVEELLPIIKPVKLLDTLLDEIKLRRPSASVKGAIWTLVGLLQQKYANLVHNRLVESQDVCLQSLQEQVRASKPEIKAIIGMIKGLSFMLCAGCTLDDRDLQGLYILIKTIITPIEDVNNRGVMKAGMKLFSQHANLLTDQILKDALDLIKLTLRLCVQDNIEVRDAANELLGSLMNQISDSLQANQDQHVQLFRNIMYEFDQILNANDYRNIQLLSAIRAVGIFSKAIQTINGDEKLWDYLERLTELSELKLIKEFMEQQNPESDLHNFKYILKKQKQLIAYIESYSFIIRNLTREPSEKQLQHFMKIGSIGVNNHRKLYSKYRFKFYESLAQLSMSLSNFSGPFGQWMKKFVRISLTETLKIPDSVIFGGESPAESLEDAVQFWCQYLTKDEIWTKDACMLVYDELVQTALNDIVQLNLTYKVQKINLEKEDFAVTQQSQFEQQDSQRGVYNKNTVEYIANNQNDQSYLVRLSNFLEGFLSQCHDEWLLKWVPNICQILVKKSTQTPRISKLYSLLKTVLKVCSRHKYFDKAISLNVNGLMGEQLALAQQRHAQMESERLNTFNMLLTYLKELIGKSEEFQDNLLTATMEMLLHVPISILYKAPTSGDKSSGLDGSQNENIHLWKGVMIKALELSRINNRLAMTCIKMLEQWFNTLPVSVTADLYADVVPKLSDFLIIQQTAGKAGDLNPDQDYYERDGQDYSESYYFQEKLKENKEEFRKIDRRDIANKVLDLLGKIGGHAHSIINNELSKKHDKENVIKWDTEKRLKFVVPMHMSKIEIYLDASLPRIVDLAQNSTDKLTRIAACELLHALILYMIGKSATNPNIKSAKGGKRKVQKEQAYEDSAAFAKLYAKLFPVIIRLATEIEQISRQLFEPLCFQIVRWFSSSKIYENAAVESLLEALIDGAQSRNNSTLREMCSNAVAVFAEWSLHGKTEAEISDNQSNIKSLIRRIESNSNHPDPFKRLSAVLCFSKIFTVIKDYNPLIDQFCLEITRCVLGSLKMCHNSLDFSQEVIDNCSQLLKVIEKQIITKVAILLEPNPQRSLHTSLHEFLDFIFSKFTSVETVYRHECMNLWEGLVTALPQPKSQGCSVSKQIQNWIKTRYVPKQGKKPIYWNIQLIDFNCTNQLQVQNSFGAMSQQDSRKGRLADLKKHFDQFTAQLEFIHWLLKVAKFNFSELQSGMRIDVNVVALNLRSLFDNVICPVFSKISNAALQSKQFSLTKLLVCKEDKEQLTKSKIRMLSKMFTLVNYLEDASLEKFLVDASAEDCDMQGQDNLGNQMFDLALQVCLIPASHQLQLLVQDLTIEKMLREQCDLYIKRKFAEISSKEKVSSFQEDTAESLLQVLEQRIIPKLPITDFMEIVKSQNSNHLQPRLLDNLCQGYVILAAIDKKLKQQLIKLCTEHLSAVVDMCSVGNQPQDNESCRLLVNFMSKFKIPNETLFQWLTEKHQVYQKTSDLILQYIGENWQNDPEQVGDYLVNKAGEDMKILQVFIPIIQYISQNTPGYQRVLLRKIPEYWKTVNFTEGYADYQVKIYSLIVSKCKWTLEKGQDADTINFINFLCIQILIFLNNTKFSVYLKKQVLSLIGLLYELKITDPRQNVHSKLKDSLLNLQKEFFPIKTRELTKHSNKAMNFEHIVEGFLDLVDLSKNLDVFRMLYKCIREMKPAFFTERLKTTVNNLVLESINPTEDIKEFFNIVDGFMGEFTSTALDQSVDDNIRWAIAHKIIQRIFETCSLSQLEFLMVKYHNLFKSILEKPLHCEKQIIFQDQQKEDSLRRYMLVREKTHVFLFLEVMVRRLDAEILKGQITQAIYGKQCQANEMTKYLILTANEAKFQKIDQFFDHEVQCELAFLNSSSQVHRRYNCAAYTLLASVILKTQTKEHLFTSYLFKNNNRNKDSVWQMLVDCTNEQVYQFQVQTNFNFINLKAYESKHDKLNNLKPHSRSNLMLQEYVTTSFMSANEKFNSAMVFETQLDEQSIQNEKLKVDELLRKKMRFMGLPQQLPTNQASSGSESQNNFFFQADDDIVDHPEMDGKTDLTLELDCVNKHECMKNIKRCLLKMQELFQPQWTQNGSESAPEFMQELLNEVEKPNSHLNIKIFIFKLLVNNNLIFKPYAQMWFEPICNFIIDKNTGGKGFHYFLRDLTTLLIQWSDFATPKVSTKAMKELCSKVINTLAKMSADKSKLIFNINIEIVATLLHNWRHLVTIDKTMMVKMLNTPETIEGSHLWKMTAIQLTALACSFNVPVLSANEIQFLKDEEDHSHEFRIFEKKDKKDELLVSLVKMQDLRKKQLIFASSEALGKLYSKQPSLVEITLQALMINEAQARHDIFVNVIERVSREYPLLLDERQLFVKLVAFINVLTGSMRAAVFKTLDRYIQVSQTEALLEVSNSLQAVAHDILADISEENQQNFLLLISTIVRLNRESGSNLLTKVAQKLKHLFACNKNELTRGLFYDLMVFVYENFPEFKQIAKSSIIRGLSDPSKEIRDRIIEWWNNPARLDSDPTKRVEQILSEIYDPEEEHIWLNNAIFLLLQVSEKTADFNQKIFDFPLSDCKFDPLSISHFSSNINDSRQQPVTSSFALMQQMVLTASQAQIHHQQYQMQVMPHIKREPTALQDIKEEDVEMQEDNESPDLEQMIDTRSKLLESQGMTASQQRTMTRFPQTRNNSSLVAHRFNNLTVQASQSQGSSSSPPQKMQSKAQAFEGIRGPQIRQAGTGTGSGFTLVKAPKDEDGEIVQQSQDDYRKNSKFQQQKFEQRKPDSVRSQFFAMNEIKYTPIQESQNNMIRYIPDGSMPGQLARKDEKRRLQREQMIQRQLSFMNKQVNLMRNYRVGDLPDIQIDFKDVLLPLMALVRRDSTIATEVFVEVFTQLYKDTLDEKKRSDLGQGIVNILVSSNKFDYGAINCMHRVAIELLKIDQFTVDAEVIARTGKHSMSFQTALILLEETILHGSAIKEAELQQAVQQAQRKLPSQKAEKPDARPQHASFTFGKISKASKAYWFKLIELYELIGNDDALKGIWRGMEDTEKVLLKEPEEVKSISDFDYAKTVELLKIAQSLRAKGSISDGLKVLEQALCSSELNKYFEEQVLFEQQNKKFEAMSDLLKWDALSDQSLKLYGTKQLYEIPFQQSEIMIRALLRKDSNWVHLVKLRQLWLSDPLSQVHLEKRFNFEQAMLFITESDFDRAQFFITKEANDLINQWQDMTKLSQVAQHILVQKIQKIYEMKEFLQVTKLLSIKGQNEMLPVMIEQVQNWVQRQPSYSFDKLCVWDDILTSRKLYLRCYELLLCKNLKGQEAQSFESKLLNKSEFSDIGAILYAQCAKGAFRMGMFDTCVRYLQTCLEQRSKDNKNNLQIILPIIKLKTEQFKQETCNLDSQIKFEKLKDIKKVLESKLQQVNIESHGLKINVKAFLLRETIVKKLINLTMSDIKGQRPGMQIQADLNERLSKQVSEAFTSFDQFNQVINKLEESPSAHSQTEFDMKRAKTCYRFSKLCDKLLRKMEQSPLLFQSISQSLTDIPMLKSEIRSKKKQANYEALACMTIKLSLNSMNLGYLRASDAIPRLLDIAAAKGNSDSVGQQFAKESKDTPAWIFLRWVNQLVAVINKPEGTIVAEKVRQIARKYPQALYYPFNVIQSNIEVNMLSSEIQTTDLFNVIKKYFSSKFENLNAWTESLSCLVNPEHRAIQWLQLILDVLREPNWKPRVAHLLSMFISDVANQEKPFIGNQIGSYNRKFATWIQEQIDDKNLQNLSQEKIEKEVKSLFKKVCQLPLLQGEKDLWLFSEFLNELDNNDFYNPDQYIEVPGQLEGTLLQEPIASKNVKIASVRQKILVLGSIRRPKKITVHGSNEKDFHLLIKGGEDLRLDQRIQQVFTIMNKIFKEDSSCQNRDINLKTFKVVPVTNRLGTLEWVENTEMLKTIINREYVRLNSPSGKLGESKSLSSVRETIKKDWLKKIPGNENIPDIVGQHLKLLEVQSNLVVNAFKKQQQLIPWHLLRTGLENLCLTSQAFITIKNQFVKSMAVFSIASYLIGIGDRHLENFLVDTTDGEVLGIDFGIAFGSGVELATPELMPFRLTQQIEGVIAPHPLEGAYKQTMVHTLSALRKKKSLILDTCDIFVKEPLLDWTKEAKKKLHQQLSEDEVEQRNSEETKGHEREMEELAFLPRQKIEIVKQKISGVNPVQILRQELNESTHVNKKYFKQLLVTIQGPPGSHRNNLQAQKKTYLDVEEQVDCLIEAARDPDILGRVWLGWSAYI